MENRKWEEELAGRWREVLELAAGGSSSQVEKAVISDERPVISKKERRTKERKLTTENQKRIPDY